MTLPTKHILSTYVEDDMLNKVRFYSNSFDMSMSRLVRRSLAYYFKSLELQTKEDFSDQATSALPGRDT